MNKKVSVIIPTFKRSHYLERSIDSILSQTYRNVEVVVVDDNHFNSKHQLRTANKMEKYSFNNKVKYIKNKQNLGGALARNEGIFKATGDFITFLDDDDIYLPKKIEVQLNYMIDNKLDMSFTDVRIHDQNDILIDYREHSYIKSFSKKELLKKHIMYHLTPTATYMFSREKLLSIGGFEDAQMGQEFFLMLKAIESDLKIGYLPNAHLIQYLHDGERISIGENKLIKEKELYAFKKKYFSYLNSRERKYVKFRHHAVMMIVGKRSNKKLIMINHLVKSLLTSPYNCILAFYQQRKKVLNHRRVTK